MKLNLLLMIGVAALLGQIMLSLAVPINRNLSQKR